MLRLTGIDITESVWAFKARYRKNDFTIKVNMVCARLPESYLRNDKFKLDAAISRMPKNELRYALKDNSDNYILEGIEFPLDRSYGKTTAPIYLTNEQYWDYFTNKLKLILNGCYQTR